MNRKTIYLILDHFYIVTASLYLSQYNTRLIPVNYTWNLGTSVTDKIPIL